MLVVLCDRVFVGPLHRVGRAHERLQVAERGLGPEQLRFVGLVQRREAHRARDRGHVLIVATVFGQVAVQVHEGQRVDA
jgi:hypothetical protein